jgi:predicted Zn-dependent peptidase
MSMQEMNNKRIKKLNNSFSNIFKSIKGSYNLLDFAQKTKGKSLPRTRKSFKEEYEILNAYKDEVLSRDSLKEELMILKNINKNQAEDIIRNIDAKNVVPMRLE